MSALKSTEKGLKGFLDRESSDDFLFERQERYGVMIYRTAWLVEILAASAGLFIAWTSAWVAYEGLEVKDNNAMIRAFGGALPFVIIAVIEPTKIYLASGVYHAKAFLWKFVFAVGLLTLTFVTFETMYNGLVQQNTNINVQVEKIRNERTDIETDIAFRKSQIADFKQETEEGIRASYNEQVVALRERFESKRNELERSLASRLRPVEAGLEDIRARSLPDIEKIDTQIVNLNADIERSNKNIDGRIAQKRNQRAELVTERSAELARLSAEWFAGEEEANVKRKYDRRISSVDDEIDAIEQQRVSDQAAIKREISSLRRQRNRLTLSSSDAKSEIQRLEAMRAQIRNEQEGELSELQAKRVQEEGEIIAERDRKIGLVSANQIRIPELEKSVEQQQTKLKTLEADYRGEASKLQIVQLTKTACGLFYAWCFGDDVKEGQKFDIAHFPEEKLSTVATVWFASIAFVGATIGSFLALASFVLRDPKAYQAETNRTFRQLTQNMGEGFKSAGSGFGNLMTRMGEGGLGLLQSSADLIRRIGAGLNYILVSVGEALKIIASSFRKLMLDIRRYLRAPKIKYEKVEVDRIVEKRVEVPVEKIVYKEVPKEIVRTKLVYVPLYSVEEGKVQMNPEMVDNLTENEAGGG